MNGTTIDPRLRRMMEANFAMLRMIGLLEKADRGEDNPTRAEVAAIMQEATEAFDAAFSPGGPPSAEAALTELARLVEAGAPVAGLASRLEAMPGRTYDASPQLTAWLKRAVAKLREAEAALASWEDCVHPGGFGSVQIRSFLDELEAEKVPVEFGSIEVSGRKGAVTRDPRLVGITVKDGRRRGAGAIMRVELDGLPEVSRGGEGPGLQSSNPGASPPQGSPRRETNPGTAGPKAR